VAKVAQNFSFFRLVRYRLSNTHSREGSADDKTCFVPKRSKVKIVGWHHEVSISSSGKNEAMQKIVGFLMMFWSVVDLVGALHCSGEFGGYGWGKADTEACKVFRHSHSHSSLIFIKKRLATTSQSSTLPCLQT
jgi:hypothetical protein